MTSATLRIGGRESCAAMVAVMESAFDPEFGEAWSTAQLDASLLLPETLLLVAENRQELAGFALVRIGLDDSELLLLAVQPSLQRAGIGKLLVNQVCIESFRRKCSRMLLEVRASNKSAIALYRNLGFAEVGRRRDYYCGAGGSRHDAVTMARLLHDSEGLSIGKATYIGGDDGLSG